MSAFRCPRDCTARKDYQPHTLMDSLIAADEHLGSGGPVSVSSLEISLLGFRARSSGKTGFAALEAMRRDHPAGPRPLHLPRRHGTRPRPHHFRRDRWMNGPDHAHEGGTSVNSACLSGL